MTNYDFINSMTLDELSKFLGGYCPPLCDDSNICVDNCVDCWKKWLKEKNSFELK